MKLETITLVHVEFMPKQLEPGVLYVSEKYGTAAHLCACGCGEKIRTPLGPTEWSIIETPEGPSLWPSIGNWQKPCHSHYVIDEGKVLWCGKWTPQQIIAGRRAEELRRQAYYKAMYARAGVGLRVWRWIKALLKL
jgi:hypothetical protein